MRLFRKGKIVQTISGAIFFMMNNQSYEYCAGQDRNPTWQKHTVLKKRFFSHLEWELHPLEVYQLAQQSVSEQFCSHALLHACSSVRVHTRVCQPVRAHSHQARLVLASIAEAWPCLPCDPDTTCLLPWLRAQSRFSGLAPGITFPCLNNQACAPVAVKWTKLHSNSLGNATLCPSGL